MGKQGDLWDDSDLIKAFDNAISKYKIMHSGEKSITDTDKNESDDGGNKFLSDDKNLPDDAKPEATVKIGEMYEISQVKEDCPIEQDFSTKCVASSDIENSDPSPANGKSDAKLGSQVAPMIASGVHSQDEAAGCSDAPEEYSQLLNKYYDIESQRQLVLQQLNQYTNLDYQNPMPCASSEEYQTSAPQPYNAVTCYCPYGCQNWTVPSNSVPDSCLSGICTGNTCNDVLRESQTGNPKPPEGLDSIKTASDPISKALLAAETALSSLKKEGNGVKDKQPGMEICNFAESTESPTDLSVVLNAWYTAGFYTGKYCSEQSMEKRKEG